MKPKKELNVVIKIGTNVVLDKSGRFCTSRIKSIIKTVCELKNLGYQFVIVSSGAVGLGRQKLNLAKKLKLEGKQTCAAVGQSHLVQNFQNLFSKFDLQVGQILLTAGDFSDRRRYLSLRKTLLEMLRLNVIPLINENDSISTMELADKVYGKSFGDNDKLSAITAAKLGADLLVILTDVDGIYKTMGEKNPKSKDKNNRDQTTENRPIPIFDSYKKLKDVALERGSSRGRGGMQTKIEAIKIAALSGATIVVANGHKPSLLKKIICGVYKSKPIPGSLILPQKGISPRKRWIGFSSGVNGKIVVNKGAQIALSLNKASLLPSGIEDIKGKFSSNEIVSIETQDGLELGRGICFFDYKDVKKISGKNSREIKKILGTQAHSVVIHRDNLVIFEEN